MGDVSDDDFKYNFKFNKILCHRIKLDYTFVFVFIYF